MKIETRKFGLIEVDDEKIIKMPYGLAGFPGRERFVILEKEDTRPFCWLQCVEDPDVALIIMDPFLVRKDYAADYHPILDEMGWEEEQNGDILLYVVVNVKENPENDASETSARITANLMGPLVVNSSRKEAVQMVMHDSPYSFEHPVV